MKRLSIETFFLVFFFVLSLIFTYFLLFDLQTLQELLGGESSDSYTVVHNESQQALDEMLNYYTVSDATLSDLIVPEHWYVFSDEKTYEIAHPEAIDELVSQMEQHPFVIDNFDIVQNDSTITHVLNQPHYQLNLSASIPLQLLKHWIQDGDMPTRNFEVDRILIEMKDNNVYFMDYKSQRFVRGSLNDGLSVDSLNQLSNHYRSYWVEVDLYKLASKDIYLPIDSQKMFQKRYLLDRIPESLLVQAVFPLPNYVLSREGDANTEGANHQRIYQSYESTLTFDPENQVLHLLKNSIADPKPLSQADAIVESFVPVKLYNYWNEELRYTGSEQTTHYYRRYLDGYPIYSTLSRNDYGQITTKVFLPSTHQTEEYRFKTPTIILQAEISDERKEINMRSGAQLVDDLYKAGISLDEVENIQLGYNWGTDMQQYQVVDLTPHWFIEMNQEVYTLEELIDGYEESHEEAE